MICYADFTQSDEIFGSSTKFRGLKAVAGEYVALSFLPDH